MAKVTLTLVFEDVEVDGVTTVEMSAEENIEGVSDDTETVETSRILSWVMRSVPENDDILEAVTQQVFTKHMQALEASKQEQDGVSGSEEEESSTP